MAESWWSAMTASIRDSGPRIRSRIPVAASDAARGLADFSNRGEDYADIAVPDGSSVALGEINGHQGRPAVHHRRHPRQFGGRVAYFGRRNQRRGGPRRRILLSADTEPKLQGLVRWSGLMNILKALNIYDDLVELNLDKVGSFTPGRLTQPLNFTICGLAAKVPLGRMRKIRLTLTAERCGTYFRTKSATSWW